jgi:hypothetical protein
MNRTNASRIGPFLGVTARDRPLWHTVEIEVEHQQLMVEQDFPRSAQGHWQ